MNENKEEFEKIKLEYLEKLNKYIDSADDNELNKIFTDITILRLKTDKHDSIFKNLRDYHKRKNELNKINLIKLQFEDIFDDGLLKRPKEELDVIKLTLDKLFEKNKDIYNPFLELWKAICRAAKAMQE